MVSIFGRGSQEILVGERRNETVKGVSIIKPLTIVSARTVGGSMDQASVISAETGGRQGTSLSGV